MNKRIKKLWLAALRSGKYKQSVSVLHDKKGYCCLGVLTLLYNKEKGYGGVKNNYLNLLSGTVCKWAGLPSNDPSCGGRCLSTWNDTGHDFNIIADKIEECL